ncbi:MAG TPA: DUF1176 domain-containing protein, partial [Rhizobiales bacterium]|nr:DUF1176 domain-containing protein [Hyphomicrobiales bacterium]
MFRHFVFLLSLLFLASPVTAQPASQKILAKVLAYHQKHADCDYQIDELSDDDLMVLNKQSSIVMVLCITGAYQGSSVFYMADNYDGEISVWTQTFATTDDGKKFTGTDSLTSADFDRKTKSITAFYKSRGIGDCGSTSTYTWSGNRFYLVEAGFMPCCAVTDEKSGSPQCKKFRKLREQ